MGMRRGVAVLMGMGLAMGLGLDLVLLMLLPCSRPAAAHALPCCCSTCSTWGTHPHRYAPLKCRRRACRGPGTKQEREQTRCRRPRSEPDPPPAFVIHSTKKYTRHFGV